MGDKKRAISAAARTMARLCHRSNRKPLSCLNLEAGMGNAVTGGDIGVLE